MLLLPCLPSKLILWFYKRLECYSYLANHPSSSSGSIRDLKDTLTLHAIQAHLLVLYETWRLLLPCMPSKLIFWFYKRLEGYSCIHLNTKNRCNLNKIFKDYNIDWLVKDNRGRTPETLISWFFYKCNINFNLSLWILVFDKFAVKLIASYHCLILISFWLL